MKRRYPKSYIEELEEAILNEIVRTKQKRGSCSSDDLEKGRESADVLLTLARVWSLLTQRGVD